ncbi:general transcription factor IIH subunit 2 isoform X2 [Anabrus simplex]|uniref:general transcription factor IIH subunit 2 isoform X2 n=1 Tax=Anabrus simplex TaxID=316456 RepID=UPI0034DD4125
MAEEEENTGYRWESGYEKTWEEIKENEEGLLEASINDIIQREKRKRRLDHTGRSRLGMMRHLYIIVDSSEAMSVQDLKPTRQLCTIKLLEGFVEEFFDQNPISQLGIIITRNMRAEKISELAGNPRKHTQNLKDKGVVCSVVALAAEVHVCRLLSRETGGTFNVVLDDSHFRDLLLCHVDPPAAASCLESSLIKMGFPMTKSKEPSFTMCMCHLDSPDGEGSGLKTKGYYCPQCYSRYCELPVECRACGLTLVAAPHLARSYHHLFPVASFTELELKNMIEPPAYCYACQKEYSDSDKHVYQCKTCNRIFCLDCDLFIHDTLHSCPGCISSKDAVK